MTPRMFKGWSSVRGTVTHLAYTKWSVRALCNAPMRLMSGDDDHLMPRNLAACRRCELIAADQSSRMMYAAEMASSACL